MLQHEGMASGSRLTEATPAWRRRIRSIITSSRNRYYARRLLLYLITVWGAVTITFFIFRLMPGNPMAIMLLGLEQQSGTVEDAQKIVDYYTRIFGLEQPLHMQYLHFLEGVLLRGFDLGPSFEKFPTPARDVVFRQMPWTLGLFTTSMILAWGLGSAFGALLGWFRRRRLSTLATILATVFHAVPVYFVALAVIIYVGYELRWLPARGPYAAHLQPAWTWEFVSSVLRHAILPMSSMVVVWSISWAIGMRSLMISVLGEDYLSFAQAKGLRPATILQRYAFRNALLPQVAALGIALGGTLNGAYVIEILFAYPGMGYLFVRAMGLRDYNVMLGVVLFSILAVVTLGLIIDLCLPLLDPRIRTGHE